jgi:hypothetical protein
MASKNENIRGFDPHLLTMIHDYRDSRRNDLKQMPPEALIEKLLKTETYFLHLASNSKETKHRLFMSDLDSVYDDLKDDLYHYVEEPDLYTAASR